MPLFNRTTEPPPFVEPSVWEEFSGDQQDRIVQMTKDRPDVDWAQIPVLTVRDWERSKLAHVGRQVFTVNSSPQPITPENISGTITEETAGHYALEDWLGELVRTAEAQKAARAYAASRMVAYTCQGCGGYKEPTEALCVPCDAAKTVLLAEAHLVRTLEDGRTVRERLSESLDLAKESEARENGH